MSQVPFYKLPLSLSDQVTLLQSRGMEIRNQKYAENTLLRLNYYRFAGYALHFEIFKNRQRTHQFKPGTIFDQVVELYKFDTQLRGLLFRYIEPIEIAFRAAICYELAISTEDPHWYIDQKRYKRKFNYNRFLQECQREYNHSDEVFIKNYKCKYRSPKLPPAWMMSEIISIGIWSQIFMHLVDKTAKKNVARHFATKPYFLESWIHALSVLRNFCAHHCRIWNRNFKLRPKLPNELKSLVENNSRLAALTVILKDLLKPLGKDIEFQNDWDALLDAFPNVPKDKMGFLPQIQKREQL